MGNELAINHTTPPDVLTVQEDRNFSFYYKYTKATYMISEHSWIDVWLCRVKIGSKKPFNSQFSALEEFANIVLRSC